LSEQAPLAPAGIFKAYDIRGLYGEQIDEDALKALVRDAVALNQSKAKS
jgi:hypothetical protein